MPHFQYKHTNVSFYPRGFALKIKAQRLLPSDKCMGGFSGSRQVSVLIKSVCGSDGVKRVVCSWSFFGVITKL